MGVGSAKHVAVTAAGWVASSLLLALFSGRQLCSAESAMTAKVRLHGDLFNKSQHHPSFLPVEKTADVLNVTFSFDLINIVSVDAKQQFIVVYGFIYQSWVNPFLKWNKTEYAGVDVIFMHPEDLWVPDTDLLYNIEEQDAITGARTSLRSKVAVHSNGTNVWLNHGLFKSICRVEVQYFPLDAQRCALVFGSWTLDSTKLNYLPRKGMIFPADGHMENGEWGITNVSMRQKDVKFQFCDNSFVSIEVKIEMDREYLDYFITLIIPCCLISSMIFLGFVLPPESGERVGLSITVLLAMTVFQQLTSELMPSYGLPLLGQYYFCIILEIGASIVITTVILSFYHRKDQKMPTWLKTVTLDWLAPLVFLKKDTQSRWVVEKKMSRRPKKKRPKSGLPVRYNSIFGAKRNSNAGGLNDGENTRNASEFHFSDAAPGEADIQGADHGSAFCMNNYSVQFGNVNHIEHSGRENDDENPTRIDDDKEPSDSQWQWTLAARTLDRVFLVIAVICGIVTVCAVFLQAPSIRHGRKALSKDSATLLYE